jgi:hypothetical protein
MTKEELREHCEKQVKACEMWAENRGQEPSGKIYEEHKLILDLIKALEQQPSKDCVSRQAVDKLCFRFLKPYNEDNMAFYEHFCDLPPVIHTHGTCKDCRWLTTDEDGNYYCRQTWDFDSLDFYCADYEKRGNVDGSN